MKISQGILISIVIASLLSSTFLPNSAFAQMESLRITGYQYPEVNSVFNVNLIVQGTSRSSGGLFDVHITIYPKDKPTWLTDQIVMDLYSGPNKLTLDLKAGIQPYTPNVSYILEAQHARIISTFEFVPVDKSSGVPPPIIETPHAVSPLEQLMEENEALKKKIKGKDAIIMEQIRVIQNLASMIRNIIFVPILNYFEI
ncbi:MAG: hypothetical protein O6746_02975 [Thaumarchaeota archaeon]|nr:hypothetical protein [Nitrososphaerota archaeon]